MAKIGIDFGTTYTVVSLLRPDGRAEAIRIEGDEKIPTILYYSPEGGVPQIGQHAMKQFETCQNIEDIDNKRLHMAGFVIKLKRDLKPHHKRPLPDGRYLSDSDIIADFFRYIKKEVEISCFSGETITDVCLTYPVSSYTFMEDILKEAAIKAGFKTISLLKEPIAASIGFEQFIDYKNSSVLIYDFGGGTIDLACVRFDSEGDCEIIDTMGYPDCGGEDIDKLLYDEWDKIVMKESNRHICEIEGELDIHFLKNICRNQKEYLCNFFKNHSQYTHYVSVAGKTRTMPLTKIQWNNLISPIIDRTIELTRQMVTGIMNKGQKIDRVILIGGSSRIPLVRERLSKVLPVKPQPVHDLDIAVAKGAAIVVNHPAKPCYCRIDGKQISTSDKTCPFCGTNNFLYDYMSTLLKN